jgi:hypothetical protein
MGKQRWKTMVFFITKNHGTERDLLGFGGFSKWWIPPKAIGLLKWSNLEELGIAPF